MNKQSTRQKVYLSIGVLLVAAIIVGIVIMVGLHNQTQSSTKVIPVQPHKTTNMTHQGANAQPTSTSKNQATANQNTGASSSSDTTQALSNSPQAAILNAPSGAFVSNHNPDLTGKPYPSEEASSCNTTPGASCYIKFIGSNGQVKSLPAQITNNTGSTQWIWNVNGAGFTVGEWQIVAVATLNNNTKSTTDPIKLNVQE